VNQDSLTEEWNDHLESAEKTRAKLNVDKLTAQLRDGSSLVFAFDLQKTKPLPYLTTSEAYYKRQLSAYNCGIHDCGTGKGYFHMWHEACASRGPCEIASCIWYWLNRIKAENEHLPTNITAYSDACGVQNRNITMAVFWMHVVQQLSVTCIDHIFMVSGHSFLPCDEDFGVDEKEKRKKDQVFTVKEWISVAERAKKIDKFDVTEMDTFLNFKLLTKMCTNRKTDVNGQKVEWMKIRWMRFIQPEVNSGGFGFLYKYSVDPDEEFKYVDMHRKG